MRSILRVFPNNFFASLAILGLIVGLVTSKVVLSVATITIMCNALINIRAGENIKTWWADNTNKLFFAILVVYLLSGLYSQDTGYWIDRCRMKLPFLALPLGFSAVKKLTTKDFNRWLAIFFYTIVGASLVVLINYLFHYETLNYKLTLGQPIPAPLRDHIRFSLEVAFAIIIGGYLRTQGFYFFSKNEKNLLTVCTVFLIVCIHIFAVRSGIVTLYIAVLIVIFQWLFSKKEYLKGVLAIALLVAFAFASIHYVPSLKSRVSYFNYEMSLIKKGELHPEHSDAQRLLSMIYGWQIAEKNPVIGVGAGDIKNEMDTLYQQHAGSEFVKSKLPHNQFIYFMAATGIVGLSIFLFSIFYPWFSKQRYKNKLFTVFFTIMFMSFLAEHTLEIQLGTAFYLVFLILIKKYIDDNEIPENTINTIHA